jgi:hypothetical protein
VLAALREILTAAVRITLSLPKAQGPGPKARTRERPPGFARAAVRSVYRYATTGAPLPGRVFGSETMSPTSFRRLSIEAPSTRYRRGRRWR